MAHNQSHAIRLIFLLSLSPSCHPTHSLTHPTPCLQVRMEDPSVTAEDIQFAVQQALYASAQRAAHTKRLRRETSGLMMQQDG